MSRTDPAPVWIEGDLGSEGTLRRAFGAVPDEALVHVVGIAGGALEVEVAAEAEDRLPTMEEFRALIEQNLTLQFRLVSAALPHLRRAGEAGRPASITLASSINALASYGLPAYSAAKAGLLGLAVALADPLGRQDIRVNVLALGTVPTRAMRDLYRPTT